MYLRESENYIHVYNQHTDKKKLLRILDILGMVEGEIFSCSINGEEIGEICPTSSEILDGVPDEFEVEIIKVKYEVL